MCCTSSQQIARWLLANYVYFTSWSIVTLDFNASIIATRTTQQRWLITPATCTTCKPTHTFRKAPNASDRDCFQQGLKKSGITQREWSIESDTLHWTVSHASVCVIFLNRNFSNRTRASHQSKWDGTNWLTETKWKKSHIERTPHIAIIIMWWIRINGELLKDCAAKCTCCSTTGIIKCLWFNTTSEVYETSVCKEKRNVQYETDREKIVFNIALRDYLPLTPSANSWKRETGQWLSSERGKTDLNPRRIFGGYIKLSVAVEFEVPKKAVGNLKRDLWNSINPRLIPWSKRVHSSTCLSRRQQVLFWPRLLLAEREKKTICQKISTLVVVYGNWDA